MPQITEIAVPFADELVGELGGIIVKPGDGSIADRLFVVLLVPVARGDGRAHRIELVEVPVDDAKVSTFSAGDAAALRALFLKLWNHGIAVAEAPK